MLLGAQTMHWEAKGAYTGEISAPMLVDLGCRVVILGHSERRVLFGETDEQVARKTAAALVHGLTPIVCVGEALDERDRGEAAAVIAGQLGVVLARRGPGTRWRGWSSRTSRCGRSEPDARPPGRRPIRWPG